MIRTVARCLLQSLQTASAKAATGQGRKGEGGFLRYSLCAEKVSGSQRPARVMCPDTRKMSSDQRPQSCVLFLFTHLTVERCPFLFIYLVVLWKLDVESGEGCACGAGETSREGGGSFLLFVFHSQDAGDNMYV